MLLVTVIADTECFKGEVLTGDGVQHDAGPSHRKINLRSVYVSYATRWGGVAAVEIKTCDLYLWLFF